MFEFSLACAMLKDVVIGPHQGGSKTAQNWGLAISEQRDPL